jgi:formylmethanofuran dehydrogenase subunit E
VSEYYDGGSMRGSGIYAEVVSKQVTCPHCNESWSDDFQGDDWGNIEEEMVCWMCNTDFYFHTTVRGE